MLAERGGPDDLDALAAAGYVFDLKIDGIRAMVRTGRHAGTSKLTMTSRNDLDLTRRFPDLVVALEEVAAEDLVLDAEIAVTDARGLPSWPLTQQRTAQRSATRGLIRDLPAHLFVFDVLAIGTQDTTGWPFRRRRLALEELATRWHGRLQLIPEESHPGSLWRMAVESDLEGLVAKHPESRYRPGRSRDWVKVKAVKTVKCLVGGVEWSGAEGSSEPRSLSLYVVGTDGDLVPVGRASAGVSAPMRRQLRAGLARPPIIVEVEYSQFTAAGVLRQPVVRRVRTDVDVLACGIDQLPLPHPTPPPSAGPGSAA
jgi:bifunctional non-homologous end joining protein LigD